MDFGPQDGQQRPPPPDVARRRLEAFSDAVFAIAITLLALSLQVPVLEAVTPQALVAALAAKWPTYLSFLLSFVTLLIAWVYHHRLLQGAKRMGTGLFFTNGMLLLIVSSVPFPTGLLGAYLATAAGSVVCYLRGLSRSSQSYLQPALVGSGAAADRLYRGSQATVCSGGWWRGSAEAIYRVGIPPRA